MASKAKKAFDLDSLDKLPIVNSAREPGPVQTAHSSQRGSPLLDDSAHQAQARSGRLRRQVALAENDFFKRQKLHLAPNPSLITAEGQL